ncbi:MAG: hypothetical protein Kow0032_14960 [Methyloligellaceae bacterium]
MRVGDLIKHDQRPALAGKRGGILQRGLLEGFRFHQNALMNRVRAEPPRQLFRARPSDLWRRRWQARDKPLHGVWRGVNGAYLARRVGKCGAGGVNPVYSLAALAFGARPCCRYSM